MCLLATACSGASPASPVRVIETAPAQIESPVVATTGPIRMERLADPARTVVRDAGGAQLAVLTDRARTVWLTGPERTFEEPTATDAVVTSTAWIRLLPAPWRASAADEKWFTDWLRSARADRSPDLFATAFEYVHGARRVANDKGLRVSGDASFGPANRKGEGRLEANDFYDYLGIDWTFPDRGRQYAEKRRYGSLDCSGFVRMVVGYRLGYLLRGGNGSGPGLPRRAFAIEANGPGVSVVPDRRSTATAYGELDPGDLVFFQTEGDSQIDHMGIFLGVDDSGMHRFLSSRERADGPTMGDIAGASVLDDGGFYSRGWRAARRI